MPTGGSTTMVEASNTSNRRQPVRQTRTQPPKYAFTGGRALSGRGSLGGAAEERSQINAEPGFFPGLTHFADSITALPKEMSRHITMLKEVDAKIYHPENNLKRLVQSLSAAPVPVPFAEASRLAEAQSQANSANNSRAASVNGVASVSMANQASQMSFRSQITATSLDTYDIPRRKDFLALRHLMNDMLPILEEKNHVIATATDALAKHLARAESSWPEIEREISEETRLGNINHWAYTDRTTEKKDGRAERPRREAAVHHNFAAVGDNFGSRGNGKRRHQQAEIELEIEETRANKRALGAGKAKKPAANQATAVGLGLLSGVTSPNKRRKVEEATAAGGVEMQKSMSTVFGKSAGGKGTNSPRSRSPAGAKRARAAGNTLGVNGKGRARAGTGASAANSPLVSSPAVGTYAAIQKPNASPALGHVTMARSASSRGRQNSTQHSLPGPTSAPKQANGTAKQVEEETVAPAKATTRAPRVDAPAEEQSESRPAVKREDSSSRQRPPSIATGTRASGKASKNATPIHASFAEATSSSSRPRSNRAGATNDSSNKSAGAGSPALGGPPKRSHKKGAGIAAMQAAQRAAAAVESQSPADGDGGDEDLEPDESEKRYCYCNSVSYGDMVGCDGEGCEKEWFHLGCIGLDKVPAGKAKWYCKDCKRANEKKEKLT